MSEEKWEVVTTWFTPPAFEGKGFCVLNQRNEVVGYSQRVDEVFLMAAAPDLLEAAEEALNCLESPYGYTQLSREYQVKKLRKAIAKAKGEG